MKKKNVGFTTVELLVNISLVLLLSGLIITYSRVSERQIIFTKERFRFSDTLYKARNLSIQTFSEISTPCGFGVEILNENDYVLFKDLPSDDSGKCTSADNSFTERTNKDELLEYFSLEDDVIFDLYNNSNMKRPYSVVFIPPRPDIIISRDSSIYDIRINLKDKKGNITSEILVNKFGQISFIPNARN